MKYKYVFYDNNLKTAPGVGALGAAGARRFLPSILVPILSQMEEF